MMLRIGMGVVGGGLAIICIHDWVSEGPVKLAYPMVALLALVLSAIMLFGAFFWDRIVREQ